jgi:hypothetical protein
MTTLSLTLDRKGGASEPLSLRPSRLIVAGWAGRDQAAVQHHIDELAAIGIAPPSTTPLFYAVSASLLTQASAIEMLGDTSSGEVEPWLISTEDGLFISVGSDHTDRKAEAWSVPHSKQLCAKPVASTVWRFEDVLDHWDSLILRSWIPADAGGWTLYQDGTVSALRRPDDLAALAGGLPRDASMLCGTLPAIGGVRAAAGFRMELHDPVLDRSITHHYMVSCLPIVV